MIVDYILLLHLCL